MIISFVSILNTSQNTCTDPHGPTLCGPRRHWKAAQTLRSMYIIIMAITTYIRRRQTPMMTHSRKTASPSGITDVNCVCIQFVTTPKSNIYRRQFLVYTILRHHLSMSGTT